jgi:sugar-specific transcriptional regulator TrmB
MTQNETIEIIDGRRKAFAEAFHVFQKEFDRYRAEAAKATEPEVIMLNLECADSMRSAMQFIREVYPQDQIHVL